MVITNGRSTVDAHRKKQPRHNAKIKSSNHKRREEKRKERKKHLQKTIPEQLIK